MTALTPFNDLSGDLNDGLSDDLSDTLDAPHKHQSDRYKTKRFKTCQVL